MTTKKLLASTLAAAMLVGCSSSTAGSAATTTSGSGTDLYPTPEGVTYTAASYNESAPDWSEYDSLIDQIKTTLDMEERVELMHKAEDILMGTGVVVPIYYYNDVYLQSTDVDGIYSSLFGTKYFMFASAPNNKLSINLASEPDKIDPALNTTVDGACIVANLFSGMYTYNSEGSLEPDLLETENPYEVSDDGLTYTLHLQKGLKWSDGSDLTMKDFKYAWDRAVNPDTASDYEYMYAAIDGYEDGKLNITLDDDYTMTVVLSAPCAYFLDLLAFPTFFPVKQSEVEGAKGADENPGAWATEAGFVSNGAYTLTSWKHNESMTFTKNENYHKADDVTVETIDLMLSADDTAIYAAYQSGDLDFADSVPTNEISNLLDSEDFHIVDNLGTYYVCFNANSELFEGKTVEEANAMRKAISLLIDRDYIATAIGQTGQVAATSFVPAGMADGNGGVFKTASAWTYTNGSDGYYPDEKSDANTEAARALLEEAGYEFNDDGTLSDSTPLSFTYLTNDGTGHIAIAEAIQQDLAEVGISMEIKTQEWNTFVNDRKAGNFDVAREGWLADFNDPVNMLEIFYSTGGNNDAQLGVDPATK